jgi:hypothetical protein
MGRPENAIRPSNLGAIPVVATLILAAIITVNVSTSGAPAEDCLVSPNSPAPNGRWWYYRLNRLTHRKCWYLRAIETEQTTERTTKTRASDSTRDSSASSPFADTAPVGSIVPESSPFADTALVGSIVPDAAGAQASPGWQANVPAAPTRNDVPAVGATANSADADRPAEKTSAPSQSNAKAVPVGDVASPDAVPRIMAHASTDDAAALGADDYIERVVRSQKQAAIEPPPLSIFVTAISALAVIGIGIYLVRRLRFS